MSRSGNNFGFNSQQYGGFNTQDNYHQNGGGNYDSAGSNALYKRRNKGQNIKKSGRGGGGNNSEWSAATDEYLKLIGQNVLKSFAGKSIGRGNWGGNYQGGGPIGGGYGYGGGYDYGHYQGNGAGYYNQQGGFYGRNSTYMGGYGGNAYRGGNRKNNLKKSKNDVGGVQQQIGLKKKLNNKRKQRRVVHAKKQMLVKYSAIRRLAGVDEKQQFLINFLRTVFYNLSSAEEDYLHCQLMSRIILRHENCVKLLTHEIKNSLDKKFGETNTEDVVKAKLDYLKEKKKGVVDEYKRVFAKKVPENFDEYEKGIDDHLDMCTGVVFTPEDHVPKPEDYVYANDVNKSETDLLLDFQYEFLRFCYEQFYLRIKDQLGYDVSLDKRIKFHLNNGIVSLLLIEKVRTKALPKPPKVVLRYFVVEKNEKDIEKIDRMNEQIYKKVIENKDEYQQTDISDYIEGQTKLNLEALRDFADTIISFNKSASIIRYRLLKYTPYIYLSEEIKSSLFDDYVKQVYAECLNILKNDIKMSDKVFEEMERDDGLVNVPKKKKKKSAAKTNENGKIEPSDGDQEIKNEASDRDQEMKTEENAKDTPMETV